jgi:hypothetical protein
LVAGIGEGLIESLDTFCTLIAIALGDTLIGIAGGRALAGKVTIAAFFNKEGNIFTVEVLGIIGLIGVVIAGGLKGFLPSNTISLNPDP